MSRPGFQIWVGGVLLVVALFIFLVGISFALSIGEPASTTTPSSALCFITRGVPFAVPGTVLFRNGRGRQRHQRQQAVEAEVLRAAAARNYGITAPDVAMLTDLRLDEARAYLDGHRARRERDDSLLLQRRARLIAASQKTSAPYSEISSAKLSISLVVLSFSILLSSSLRFASGASSARSMNWRRYSLII